MLEHTHKPRISALDSYRGLAALTVVSGHLFALTIPFSKYIYYSPLYLLASASHEAVILFFVLSGYVLAYQYADKARFNYLQFLLQRVIRIYLPYLFAIAICFLLIWLCASTHIVSEVPVTKFWKQPITISDIWGHLLLIGNFDHNKIDPVIWSLIYEMRIAFLFPVFLLMLRLRPIVSVLSFLVISLVVSILFKTGYSNILSKYYVDTLGYFYMFGLGAVIAKYQSSIVSFCNKLSAIQRLFILAGSVALYIYAHVIQVVILKTSYFSGALADFIYTDTVDFLIVIGSCGLIIYALMTKEKPGLLATKPLLFLGRISYAWYLLHYPIWAFVYYSFGYRIPLLLASSIALIISLLVAYLFNQYVERPVLRTGKKLLAAQF